MKWREMILSGAHIHPRLYLFRGRPFLTCEINYLLDLALGASEHAMMQDCEASPIYPLGKVKWTEE